MRTLTGTYTVGGETYNYTIVAPEAAVFIYSKHVYCKIQITQTENDITSPVVNRKIQLINVQGRTLNDFRYTDQNGWAIFDIARMLQLDKNSLQDELNLDYNDTAQVAHNNIVELRFYDTGASIYLVTEELCNGADDIMDKFWNNGIRQLRWFSNYPFTFDFQNINGNWNVSTNGGAAVAEAFPYESVVLSYVMSRINAKRYFGIPSSTDMSKKVSAQITMARDESGNLVTATDTLNITIDKQRFDLNRKCYLRWIGKHGEVFYWLFRKHSVKEDVKRDTFKRAYVEDSFNSYGLLDSDSVNDYSKEASMVVYSGRLSSYEYDVVKSIVNSPCVDMLISYSWSDTPRGGGGGYLEETAKWRRISVKEGSYAVKMTDKNSIDKQMILTLSMPKEGELTL